MKTKNELILDKLVELGYLKIVDNKTVWSKDSDFINELKSFNPYWMLENSIIFDALVSECGKRGIVIQIAQNKLDLRQGYALIFRIDYTRQAVAEAFVKVTGLMYEYTTLARRKSKKGKLLRAHIRVQ